MAFDDVLIDVFAEQPVHEIEDLRFRDPPAAIADQIFEDAALAARQRQHLAADLRIAPVGEHANVADELTLVLGFGAALDRLDPRQDLPHMNRLAHHVVDAGLEQVERLVETFFVVHRDDGGTRPVADQSRQQAAVFAVADQEGFHRADIGVGNRLHPIAEVGRAKSGRRHAFAVEPGRIAVFYGLAFIHYYDHKTTPESL